MLDSHAIADDDSRSTLSSRLRAALRSSPHSRYAISKATGIDQATLSRFVNSADPSKRSGLSLRAIDLLAAQLNLELVACQSSDAERTPSDGITDQRAERQPDAPVQGGRPEPALDPPRSDAAEGGREHQRPSRGVDRREDLADELEPQDVGVGPQPDADAARQAGESGTAPAEIREECVDAR
ncbi:hypothetical protein [Lacipirellula sp.]|uniref:hypothetical protein n=1 Tax=Lacipirellula sp. TaxID=2691419 RepID=UPI003D0CFE3A